MKHQDPCICGRNEGELCLPDKEDTNFHPIETRDHVYYNGPVVEVSVGNLKSIDEKLVRITTYLLKDCKEGERVHSFFTEEELEDLLALLRSHK